MTIVVLGGGITTNGELPNQVKKRLDKAIEVSEKENVDRFLLCGKYSFLYPKKELPETTESQLMRDYLIQKGINGKNIFLESKSMDTIGNAYFSKIEYFLPQKELEAIIITSDYHTPRTKFIFEKVFGPDYTLIFYSSPSFDEEEVKNLLERGERLTEKIKKLTGEMTPGDHNFLKKILYDSEYYKEKRPKEVIEKIAKGK